MVEAKPKILNVLKLIRERVQTGDFIILPHAILRQAERNISVPDIVFVLTHGEHETERDEFKAAFGSWNYLICGKTVDSRTLRVAVAFDAHDMLIVTVIPLGKRRV